MPRLSRPISLVLELPATNDPLRHRIADAIIAAIRTGQLRSGDRLPPSRGLAAILGIGRAAVVAAYDELTASGYAISSAGSSTVVAPGAEMAVRAGMRSHVPIRAADGRTGGEKGPGPRWNLLPGFIDSALVSDTDWKRAWRRASSAVPSSPQPQQLWHPELRIALSAHLRRARGIVVDADEIFVVPGALSALALIATAVDLKNSSVVIEEPGYTDARRVLAAAGSRIRPIPVDIDGLDVGLLRKNDSAVYVTPAHQFPTGVRMSVARRTELLAWASRNGALVIEDDYDGDFRYDVSPLPALAGTPDGRHTVAYIGSASNILSPTLRTAWLIPPPYLRDAVAIATTGIDVTIDSVTGLMLADYMDSGALTRHIARVGRTYAARRRAVLSAMKRHLPDLRVLGIEAGLHVAIGLPLGVNASAVTAALTRRGVALMNMDSYQTTEFPVPALVVNYANLPESQASDAVAAIAAAIQEVRR